MKTEYEIIDRILLTEKGTRLTDEENKYVFQVKKVASKQDVKRSVEKLFGVHVTKVNTMNRKGKKKRERTVNFGHTADWKRAVVTLADGETIDLT